MSLYNGPVRAGARGGRGEFSWDNVKNDKDREYYLGHSVKALAGRWQKGKDVYWYTRDKTKEQSLEDEKRAIKEREEQLMLEALGLKPKSQPTVHQPMDEKELAAILRKNSMQEEEQGTGTGAAGAPGVGLTEADRMKGLGYHAGQGPARAASGAPGMELGGRLAGEGVVTDGAAQPSGRPKASAGPAGSGPPASGDAKVKLPGPPPISGGNMLLSLLASGATLTRQQIKDLAKQDKKAAKQAKKQRKAAKKEAKKAKKEAKRRKQSSEEKEKDQQGGHRKRGRKESDSEDERDVRHAAHRHSPPPATRTRHDSPPSRHGDADHPADRGKRARHDSPDPRGREDTRARDGYGQGGDRGTGRHNEAGDRARRHSPAPSAPGRREYPGRHPSNRRHDSPEPLHRRRPSPTAHRTDRGRSGSPPRRHAQETDRAGQRARAQDSPVRQAVRGGFESRGHRASPERRVGEHRRSPEPRRRQHSPERQRGRDFDDGGRRHGDRSPPRRQRHGSPSPPRRQGREAAQHRQRHDSPSQSPAARRRHDSPDDSGRGRDGGGGRRGGGDSRQEKGHGRRNRSRSSSRSSSSSGSSGSDSSDSGSDSGRSSPARRGGR